MRNKEGPIPSFNEAIKLLEPQMSMAKGLLGPFSDYATQPECNLTESADALAEIFNASPELFKALMAKKLKFCKVIWDNPRGPEEVSNLGDLRDEVTGVRFATWWVELAENNPNQSNWAMQRHLDEHGKYISNWEEEYLIPMEDMDRFEKFIMDYALEQGYKIINPEAIKNRKN